MFYKISDCVKEIPFNLINSNTLTAGIISVSELKKCYATLGFSESTYLECENAEHNCHSTIDVYDNLYFGMVSVVNPIVDNDNFDRFAFYIKKNLFLVVEIFDDDMSIREVFENSLNRFSPQTLTLEKLIYCMFVNLISKDRPILEDLAFAIDEMDEDFQTDDTNNNFIKQLHEAKKKLLTLTNYYEQLADVGEELQDNGNGVFDESSLRYFKLFADKADRLNDKVAFLRENIVQLREAYNAQLDYNLNRNMKFFTVIASIFLPLTLIVGWYGMNFTNMHELTWKYGYIGVIILSVLVVIGTILIFKKKKLM